MSSRMTIETAPILAKTETGSNSSGALHRMADRVGRAPAVIGAIACTSLSAWFLRFALAVPFWRSGILKWSGFGHLNDTAVDLFTSEFMLHLPGGPYPYPAPTTMAFITGTFELLFPSLLVIGFATRFSALGLLIMTVVVELTVPDGWPIHITWAAMAIAVMARGPGVISLDHLIGRFLEHRGGAVP